MATILQAHCPDLQCDGYAGSIKCVLIKTEGVTSVSVDIENKHVMIRHDLAITTGYLPRCLSIATH